MAELGDWKAAGGDVCACAGDFAKAVKIYSEHKYADYRERLEETRSHANVRKSNV